MVVKSIQEKEPARNNNSNKATDRPIARRSAIRMFSMSSKLDLLHAQLLLFGAHVTCFELMRECIPSWAIKERRIFMRVRMNSD
jgi:hypothetical protein